MEHLSKESLGLELADMTTVNLCNSTRKGYCYSTKRDKKTGIRGVKLLEHRHQGRDESELALHHSLPATCPCISRTDCRAHDHFIVNQTVTRRCAWGTGPRILVQWSSGKGNSLYVPAQELCPSGPHPVGLTGRPVHQWPSWPAPPSLPLVCFAQLCCWGALETALTKHTGTMYVTQLGDCSDLRQMLGELNFIVSTLLYSREQFSIFVFFYRLDSCRPVRTCFSTRAKITQFDPKG